MTLTIEATPDYSQRINNWESVYKIFTDKELKIIKRASKKMAKESKISGYECATGMTYLKIKKLKMILNPMIDVAISIHALRKQNVKLERQNPKSCY